MKSSNRLLLGFGIAIGAVAVVTVVLVLAFGRGDSPLLPQDTPEGTVQRFLLAVKERDYPRAYSYLDIIEERGQKVSYEQWRQSVDVGPDPATSWKATIEKVERGNGTASIEVRVEVFRPRGPFEDPVRTSRMSFELRRTVESWVITSRPELWLLNW